MNLFSKLARKLTLGSTQKCQRSNNIAGIEPLEARRLWAVDLTITSFSANGTDLVVDYQVANETALEFDIAIYRSFDGVTLDSLLTTQRIDLDVYEGSYQSCIFADFADIEGSYQLIAVIDAAGENAETDESNNQSTFGGGIFFDRDYVLHVQGNSRGRLRFHHPGRIPLHRLERNH